MRSSQFFTSLIEANKKDKKEHVEEVKKVEPKNNKKIILKDEPFDLLFISHPDPNDKKKNPKPYNIAMDFTRDELDYINLKDLPVSFEHGITGGSITSKHIGKKGPLLVTATLNGKDPVSKLIIHDILSGKTTETSLTHQYAIVPVETESGHKKHVKVYKIPKEIGLMNKGLRSDCHILFGGYRSDIKHMLKDKINMFGLNNELTSLPRDINYKIIYNKDDVFINSNAKNEDKSIVRDPVTASDIKKYIKSTGHSIGKKKYLKKKKFIFCVSVVNIKVDIDANNFLFIKKNIFEKK